MTCADSYQRSRERSEGPEYATFTKYKNGAYYDSLYHIQSSVQEDIDDVVTPCFSRLIRSGKIINNPMSYFKTEQRALPGGSYYATNGANTYTSAGGNLTSYEIDLAGQGYPPVVEHDLVSMQQRAKQLALSHVDETPYAFGEDVGEIRETLEFLKRPFGSLLKLGKSFDRDLARALSRKRKGRSRPLTKLKRYSREFSSAWLEYRFAAAPLVRSTMDALEAATWYEGTPPVRQIARGHVTDDPSSRVTWDVQLSPTAFDYFEGGSERELDVAAGILYEINNPVQDLQWRLGLRLKDVPETLWQLMPYSFMVDRIVNVSTMIRGLRALADPQVKILAGWVRTKSMHRRYVRFTGQSVSGYTIIIIPDSKELITNSYDREVWSPSVSDTVPQVTPWNLVKDVTSVLDLVTLTHSFWTKRSK